MGITSSDAAYAGFLHPLRGKSLGKGGKLGYVSIPWFEFDLGNLSERCDSEPSSSRSTSSGIAPGNITMRVLMTRSRDGGHIHTPRLI